MRGSAGGGVLLPKVSGNQRLAPGLWAGSSCSPEAFLAAPMFPETILARRGMPRTALPSKRCTPRLLLLSCAGGSWAEPGGARARGRELERLPLAHCPRCPPVQATGLQEEGSGLEAALHSSVLWCTAGLFPTPSDPPRGCCGSSSNAALLFLAVEVENPPGQGLSTLCALSVQVLDPELEVADLAFPPSTISASSLKMQVSGVGRSGDPSGEAAVPARHPVSRARRGQAWPGGGGG